MGGGGSAAQPQLLDPDRPRYHVHPPQGWMNDPNGPVFYKGRYHMFYQHLPNACEWAFGIVWGHAVSCDLVHWEHLPPALVPTPGMLDADGCFSGSCVLDSDGTPVLLYTGVRLRSNLDAGPLPPAEQDLGMVWVESQMAAVPEDPDDELLVRWRKLEAPFLHLPPGHLQLTGWRDPFVFTTNTAAAPCGDAGFRGNGFSGHIRMLIGSGLKGQGGTALVYKSSCLLAGWELEGTLCEASNTDTGVVWECPLLVPLDPVPRQLRAPRRAAPPRWLMGGAEGEATPGSRPATAREVAAAEAGRGGAPPALALPPAARGAVAAPGAPPPAAALAAAAPSRLAALQQGSDGVGHRRSSSFAFDQAPSSEQEESADQAGSSVTAWQLAADASPLAAATLDGGAAAAAALPPGRRLAGAAARLPAAAARSAVAGARRAVSGARLALDSAATLEHWSHSSSAQTTPAAGPSPLSSPERRPAAAAPPVPPQQQPGTAPAPGSPGGDSAGDSSGDSAGSGDSELGGCDEDDKFAAALRRVRSIRARKAERSRSRAARAAAASPEQPSRLGAADEADTPPPPPRQWHFFTVSPDAPTNPVLYWMGHVSDSEAARFELDTAKGPYRLDLGDVLYAPNVCQDDKGRWLLWGWLQERRKVGSYNYAGCLTLPRVLHCSEDGRLVQTPIPELTALRQGPGWRQHGTRVPAEAAVPLRAPPAAAALDIELTLDRGAAYAAGLLFRSYEAEAEGGTALVYDWDRNALEAIFNVPPAWQPQAAAAAAAAAGEEAEHFEPALLLTPRPSVAANLASMGVSRTTSAIFSPDGFESQTASASATPRTATSVAGELSSSLLSPQRSGVSVAGVPVVPPLDLGVPGLPPPPHLAEPGPAGPAGLEFARSGAELGRGMPHFGTSLPRSLSAFPAAFLGGGATALGGLAVGSLPAVGGGLYRSVSDGRAALGGLRRPGSHPALSTLAGSLPRPGFLSPHRSPQPPQPLGQDTDADLDFLLDELAAPMREAPAPVVEPRRVGGPLPLMHPAAPLHLRILVDHSCVEVYTGTGEVLSTRIYRGQAPEGCADAGISFIAFGGAAVVRHCVVHEMGSAWEAPASAAATPASAKAAAAAAAEASPRRSPAGAGPPAAAPSPPRSGRRGSALTASLAAARGTPAAAEAEAAAAAAAAAASAAAGAAADRLLDDLVGVAISPQCSSLVGAYT